MTKRERILSVLKRQRPDRLPWCADLSYWMYGLDADKRLDPKYQGEEGIFRIHRDIGAGFYLQGFFPYKETYDGVEVKHEKTGNTSTTRYITPKGTLTEIWEYLPTAYASAPKEHMVKDASDFPALRYLFEHTHYEADYDKIHRYQEYAGDNGVTLCYTPKSPFMDLVALRMGITAVSFAILDDEDEFDGLLKVMEKKHLEASALTLASACECIMVPENLSSEVVGKNYFFKYMKAYHKNITDLIRQAGKFSYIHMDGTLKGLVKEISEAGFDVVEALTPEPVGDISIEKIAELVHPDTVLWGGIPGGYFTDFVSDAEFDRYVIQVLEVLRKRPNSALGVADQVIPNSRFERIKRVDELVEQYGEPEWK
jgi:uroporphyrinogen-III decarboxylase